MYGVEKVDKNRALEPSRWAINSRQTEISMNSLNAEFIASRHR